MIWVGLWTDVLLYFIVLCVLLMVIWTQQHEHLRRPWRKVGQSKTGMISLAILLTFVFIGLLDSIHVRFASTHLNATTPLHSKTVSVLDWLLGSLGSEHEKSYSAPFATHLRNTTRVKERLHYRAQHLSTFETPHTVAWDIFYTILPPLLYALMLWLLLVAGLLYWQARQHNTSLKKTMRALFGKEKKGAIPALLYTIGLMLALMMISLALAKNYHIFGTDKVGQDVFYATIKSIRTGLMIGSLTLLFMLPFALLLGVMAGYFGGWVDDTIQYLYTLLSSVPGVLLIAAAVLSLQVLMAKHTDLFPSSLERSDARLLILCAILGITGWTPLCRLLRGSTLKLKHIEFIEAARAMGVSNFGIILRHILPNLLPLVIITATMEFSNLVLIEAVLSYIGVGVDPITFSWGNMINGARLELANSPVIWWPLSAAFISMLTLTLSANLFADVVREAFDPQTNHHE